MTKMNGEWEWMWRAKLINDVRWRLVDYLSDYLYHNNTMQCIKTIEIKNFSLSLIRIKYRLSTFDTKVLNRQGIEAKIIWKWRDLLRATSI